MADLSHGSTCWCPRCRNRRVSQSTASSARDPVIPLAPVKPTPEEQAFIDHDPLTFVLAMREQDVSTQVIRSKLVHAAQNPTESEVDGLMAQADALYQADQRERGVRRIQKGVALTVGGVIITVPLAMFGGILALGGVAVTLMGVFQLGKGIYEIKG